MDRNRSPTSPSTAIVLFAHAPDQEPKNLAPQAAATRSLHTALLLRTLGTVARTPSTAALVFATDGPLPEAIERALDDLASSGRAVHRVHQRGRDFNARLLGALTDATTLGYTRLVVVGSDTPTLRADDLAAGLDARTLVLGPSFDGGFYLVALNADQLDLLDGLPWRSDGLALSLLRRARLAGLEPRLRAPRPDIDTRAQALACWPLLARLTRDLVGVDLDAAPTPRRRAERALPLTFHTPLRLDTHRGPPSSTIA